MNSLKLLPKTSRISCVIKKKNLRKLQEEGKKKKQIFTLILKPCMQPMQINGEISSQYTTIHTYILLSIKNKRRFLLVIKTSP